MPAEKEGAALFTRQIHRFRVLKISCLRLQDLFYEQPSFSDIADDKEERNDGYLLSAVLPDLPLEELSLSFNENRHSAPPPKGNIDMQPALQILERSKNLRRLTIDLAPLSFLGQVKDMACLLAALPTTLERLTLQFNHAAARRQNPTSLIDCRMIFHRQDPLAP